MGNRRLRFPMVRPYFSIPKTSYPFPSLLITPMLWSEYRWQIGKSSSIFPLEFVDLQLLRKSDPYRYVRIPKPWLELLKLLADGLLSLRFLILLILMREISVEGLGICFLRWALFVLFYCTFIVPRQKDWLSMRYRPSHDHLFCWSFFPFLCSFILLLCSFILGIGLKVDWLFVRQQG